MYVLRVFFNEFMYDWRYVCVCVCMSVLCLRGGCIFCVTFPALAFSYLFTQMCQLSNINSKRCLSYLSSNQSTQKPFGQVLKLRSSMQIALRFGHVLKIR